MIASSSEHSRLYVSSPNRPSSVLKYGSGGGKQVRQPCEIESNQTG